MKRKWIPLAAALLAAIALVVIAALWLPRKRTLTFGTFSKSLGNAPYHIAKHFGWFAQHPDLKDFTPLCERLRPQDVAELLSTYFDHMARIIFNNKGMINKYVGDAILAIFGAFSSDTGAEGGTMAAIQMVQALVDLKKADPRFKDFNVRIGVNTGIMVCGNIGPLERIEYTVLGDPVNVASRLQSLADTNSVLIGENTFEDLKSQVEAVCLGQTALKGKQEKIKVYKVC